MKKSYILAISIFLTVCGLGFANSDKLTIFSKNNVELAILPLSEIEEIQYGGEENSFNSMNVKLKGGSVKSFNLDNISKVEYSAPLPESKLNARLIPHYNSASVKVETQPDVYWRVVGYQASDLTNFEHYNWCDVLIKNNIKDIIEDAEYYGWDIGKHMDYYFFKGRQVVEWWHPSKTVVPGTDIVVVAYSVKLENGIPVLDAEPVMMEGKTKELIQLDLNFSINAEMTSNRIKLNVDASDATMPFYVTLYSEEDFNQYTLDSLLESTIYQIENFAYTNNMTWEDVVSYGHSETTYKNKITGEKWVAVAFGIEYGVVYSQPQYKVFEIPEAEIVDQCDFDVVPSQLSLSEFSLEISPSSNDTHYVAFLANKSKFEDATTPEQYIAKKLNYVTVFKAFDWTSSEYIRKGKSTLNSHSDLIDGEYLNYGESYYVLVFGVDNLGTRTTRIKQIEITPVKDEHPNVKNLTFNVEWFGFDDSDDYWHTLNVKVTPSDLDAKFVYTCLPASNYSVDNTRPEEEIIKDYVAIEGSNLRLLTGVYSTTQSFTSWGSWSNYRIMVFGYDGEPSSRLYMYEINTENGDVVQLMPID